MSKLGQYNLLRFQTTNWEDLYRAGQPRMALILPERNACVLHASPQSIVLICHLR